MAHIKLDYGCTLEEAPNSEVSKECVLLEMQNRVVEELYHKGQDNKYIPLISCDWVNFLVGSRMVGTCLKTRSKVLF